MTELHWAGKLTQDGKKAAPLTIALPFQTIETVNESAQQRERTLELFSAGQRSTAWRNRLIWGDKKYVLPSLLPEFAGKVNLIYIDPPFDTGANFSFTATIPTPAPSQEGNEGDDAPLLGGDGGGVSFVKAPNMIEVKAYRDTWGKGLDSYLRWFYDTVVLLRELLAEDGSIYVHLDWHVGHYAKVVMDEVFGYENFINEIVWQRTNVHSHAAQGAEHFARIHDTILFYSKTGKHTWHQFYLAHSDEHVTKSYKYEEKTGRRYALSDLTVTDGGAKGNPYFEFLGITRYWRYNKEKMEKLLKEGRIIQQSSGAVPRYKRYLDESQGVEVSSLWTDIRPIAAQSIERVGYATQKPETLLERILKVSSNAGDLVLDCFCGSGTTAAVAEKLGRRWITCDLGRFAIHTARKRLLGMPNVAPFIVQNLGTYERQQWMAAEFQPPHDRVAQDRAYRRFILDLYHAEPFDGHAWLHGAKAGRLIHIGTVDAPVTVEDIKQTIREFWKLVGNDAAAQTNGVDFLGWDFAFDVNETAKQFAASNRVDVKCKKIPREVLEKKAVEQGDIRFYELAYLDVGIDVSPFGKGEGRARVTLRNFITPPDDVPPDIQKTIRHWSQWIDYWAVDWNYRDDTFHNEWQSYRAKARPELELAAAHQYAEAGTYVVLVKVIDILGNDTTKAIEIQIA